MTVSDGVSTSLKVWGGGAGSPPPSKSATADYVVRAEKSALVTDRSRMQETA